MKRRKWKRALWWFVAAALGATILLHTLPRPFLLEELYAEQSVWHMPRTAPSTVYLTYDDGPNPSTTPDLLDLLAREGVHATFFVIPSHVTEETAAIVRRMFTDGHAVALHSGNRWDFLRGSKAFASDLTKASDRIETLSGSRPCRAFRPHGGWRSHVMYAGLERINYRLIGWGWMMWDVDPLHTRTADRIVVRVVPRAQAGDIIVMHDGDYRAPHAPQPQTVEATARTISMLRAKGFAFGTICD
jgi:peptidoglycan-N-acetylglucosamine deacetylase